MSPKKKYLVCAGYVRSKNDGDRHFISFNQLIRLYGVNRDECHLYDPTRLYDPAEHKDMIALKPQFSGDYTLPKA